jgi:two-component system cell cycle sensor histidine kinase/response regulator CckA
MFSASPRPNILIVEDDASIAEIIELSLEHFGYSVSGIANNADLTMAQVNTVRPDLVLMDIEIQGSISGIELAELLRSQYSIPVVFMTAHADAATVKRAVATEPFGYLVKPVDRAVLEATFQTAMGRVRSERELARTEQTLAATLDSIGEGVVVVDGNYRVMFINNVAERLTGWSRTTAMHIPVTQVLTISSQSKEHALTTLLEGALSETGTTASAGHHLDIVSLTGLLTKTYATASPIRGLNGRVSGLAIVLRETLGIG